MMVSQDKAEAAMQVNFWSFTQLVKALTRPMMPRPRRPDRRHRLGHGHPRQPGQRGLRRDQGRARGLHAHAGGRDRRARDHGQYHRAGFVDTDMMGAYAAYRDRMEKQIPAGRFARPEEIGALCAFLMGRRRPT